MNSARTHSIRYYEEGSWPPLFGDYIVGDPNSGVAVVTLASHLQVKNAAICGTCKTENLGVEKIVANIISNSNIRFLIICGAESKGHLPGNTIIALHTNGIDDQSRIIGSKGAIPFIQNLTPDALRRFQDQIRLIERIGLEDESQIEAIVNEYNEKSVPFPEDPFQIIKRRTRPSASTTDKAELFDVSFGSGIMLDTSVWRVLGGQ
jgi:tetrahydromethanopterin S-methyltransferase subunit A